MRSNIISYGRICFFLSEKIPDILVKVFSDHLSIWYFRLLFFGFSKYDGFVPGGDGCFEIFELIVVNE